MLFFYDFIIKAVIIDVENNAAPNIELAVKYIS